MNHNEMKILESLYRYGVLQGWKIVLEAQVNKFELQKSARRLIDLHYIAFDDPIFNADKIGEVYFNITPYGNAYMQEL